MSSLPRISSRLSNTSTSGDEGRFRDMVRQPTPRSGYLSAPIPQTQWAEVPEVFRPVNWLADMGRDKPLPMPPAASPISMSLAGVRKDKRHRHRPQELHHVSAGSSSFQPDTNMLYPQLSPYDNHSGSRSAPHDMQQFPRGLYSDEETYLVSPMEDFRPSSLPRSPTYPAGSRGRMRTVSAGNDNVLQDEGEYRLFMEATTGLGPIPTFRQNSVNEDNWLQTRPQRIQSSYLSTSPPTTIPVLMSAHAGPTRVYAPRDERDFSIPRTARSPSRSTDQQRRSQEDSVALIDISEFELGDWHEEPHPADGWLGLQEDVPDDELPDYAASQAQAQATQRAAAAQRAQELQRRWREGGRKYGPDV